MIELLQALILLPQVPDLHRRGVPRLAARTGKAKAVTATARKLAILFYNALRFGMTYANPGTSYYEERYRQRVLDNLRRRARHLGFTLVADPWLPRYPMEFLRKAAAWFAKETGSVHSNDSDKSTNEVFGREGFLPGLGTIGTALSAY